MSKIWEFFENLGEYVYVADAETHELIYMNKSVMRYCREILCPVACVIMNS